MKARRAIDIKDGDARKACVAFRKVAHNRGIKYDQPTFYSPMEWRARGEDCELLGPGAVLVVTHDGGDLAPYMNWAYAQVERLSNFRSTLKDLGYRVTWSTSWYSVIEPLN